MKEAAEAIANGSVEVQAPDATALAYKEMRALLGRYGEGEIDWAFVEIELSVIAKRCKIPVPTLRRAAKLEREKLEVQTKRNSFRLAGEVQAADLDQTRDVQTLHEVTSIKDIPTVMPADAALSLMNRMFAVVHDWGGDTLIAYCQPNGELRALDERQFLRSLANRVVRGTGAQLGKWWLTHRIGGKSTR